MLKKQTPSFVTELPLKTGSYEQSLLKKRFFAGKQQYNALLGEALRRLQKMRSDPRFKEAQKLYKEAGKKTEAKQIFKKLTIFYQYREYDLYAYTKQWNTKGSALSIGARISQQLAKRAFQAVEEYRLGKRGKPRFKGRRGLQSIEDNSLHANLRMKEHVVHYLGLKMPLIYDLKDPVHYHGLNAPIKYLRIVQRTFNGKKRYVAQLVNEGKPWVKSKNSPGDATIGLDIGPQTIAVVAPEITYASLHLFADELKETKKTKKRLQKSLAKKLRIGNPHAFEKDTWEKKDKAWVCKKGPSIKGQHCVHRSKRLLNVQHQLADLYRKEASYRKAQHGRMANQIIRLGKEIKTEQLSYKAFQKLFGSSVGLRAPGMFVDILKRKAENAGGKVICINTWATKLSQTCHCGKQEKKPLSQRWHQCACGVKAQRDLYSAYLAGFVEEDRLMADQAEKAWSGMDIALCTAMRQIKRTSRGPLPSSLGIQLGSESVVQDVP